MSRYQDSVGIDALEINVIIVIINSNKTKTVALLHWNP